MFYHNERGWVNIYNYFTSMTSGYLTDIGFSIDEESEWIKNTGENMVWGTSKSNALILSEQTTNNTNQKFIKYACNHTH